VITIRNQAQTDVRHGVTNRIAVANESPVLLDLFHKFPSAADATTSGCTRRVFLDKIKFDKWISAQ